MACSHWSYLITNMEPVVSVNVRSHCSGFVKLVVECYGISKPLKSPFSCAHIVCRFCEDKCECSHKDK